MHSHSRGPTAELWERLCHASTAHELQKKHLRLPRRLPAAAEAVQRGVRPVVVGDFPPSRDLPHTVWRWWKAGVRPGQHHLKALLDLADNLGLGHLFTERGCVTAGPNTQTGPNTCTAGDDAATDVAFSPVLALQRHVAQLHHPPSLPGPAPTLTSKGPRRRLPVPCPFSFACPSVGISARKTAPSGLLRLNVAVAVAHTDAKTPSQTVTPEEYALDRIITRVSTKGSNPGLALHADSSGAPAFKLCDLRNPTQVEHRIPWPGGPHFTIYLAPNCADQTLAAGTTYWPVLAANGYRPTSTTADEQGARGSGWPIGDVAFTRTSGSWSNPFSGDTTVTGSGHSER